MKVNEFIAQLKSFEKMNTKYKLGTYMNKTEGNAYLSDCSGMIKAVFWKYPTRGKYSSAGFPDINANTMIKKCSHTSTDISTMKAGYLVWIEGHIGVCVGEGIVVECTPKWKGGIQLSYAIGSGYGNVLGLPTRQWSKCGKFDQYIDYNAEQDIYELTKSTNVYMNAYDAKSKTNEVTQYSAGEYYIYNKSQGMINITKNKLSPGGWINPNDSDSLYYPRYIGSSNRLDEVLKNIGVSAQYYGSWKKRKSLALKNEINNYTGNYAQNTLLIVLAKQGILKKV